MRSNFSKLSFRLPAIISGCSVFAAVFVGALAYWFSVSNIEKQADERLTALASARAAGLKNYLEGIGMDLTVTAANPFVGEALADFETAWKTIDGNPAKVLQKAYIHDNPHPLGEKDALLSAGNTPYDVVHERYHAWFRRLLKTRGYYDIFLFSGDGSLIYTVFKDLDDLVLQVNGQTFSSLGSAVNKAVHAAKDGPPVGRLIAMANAYYDFAKAHRNRWQALFDTQFSQGDELPEWYRAEVSSLFAIIAEPVTTLRPDLNEQQVRLLVRGLFASVHGIVLLRVQKRISAVPDADVSWVMESMLRAATR